MSGFAEVAAPRERNAATDLFRLVQLENEEQLAEAQRIANVGSWQIDLATGRRTYSDQFLRMFGFDPAAPPPREELHARVHPDDRSRALRIAAAAGETGEPAVEQFRVLVPGAPPRTFLARTRVIADDNGRPLRMIGVVQDVSERVAYEEELRRVAVQQAAVANFGQLALSGASLGFLFAQVTALLRKILEAETEIVAAGEPPALGGAAVVAIPISSPDEQPWGSLRVDGGAQRVFSTTDVDFLRSVAAVLAQAAARAHADAELRLRALQQSAIAEIGRAVLTKVDDATIARACELVARGLGVAVVEYAGGGFRVPKGLLSPEDSTYVESMANILAEATGRENARAALQQTTRRLQLVLESTLEGICTVDADGRCTMVNAAAARMFGRGTEEILGAQMHELVHVRHPNGSPYPREECPIYRVVRDGVPQTVLGDAFWRADGTQIPVDYSAAPIVDGDAIAGAVVAISDTSARRALEQKLAQANRVASLGRLAATVAHEFNNVLMGISPFVEVIRRKPERAAKALDQISGAVARGKRITGDILRFTRPSELVRADFGVAPWLGDLGAHMMGVLSANHRIAVDAGDPELRANGDRHQLHQVVMNLVLNARDAMPAGGAISLSARREAPGTRFGFGAVAAPERFVHLAVADDGCGMDAAMLAHIFEPLFTTKRNGTGLGLAVAHQVVQRHGGEIFVESAAGAGTTFHLFIPLAEGGGESPAPLPAPPAPRAKGRHLLLVDDDEMVVSGLVSLLELEGIRVDAVGSGAAAIAYLRHTRPHVVLLDVGLPDMDGAEVYAQIAVMHAELPVVFSTGHADTARLEALERGPVVSLLKPYDLTTLLNAIERVAG
jgi:PAS domain S-box-containing protein